MALACQPCNQRNQTAAEFGHPSVPAEARKGLPDAAMMNAARYAIRDLLEGFGLPVETGAGGQTKYNRTRAGLAKSHWADAACVGASTAEGWRVPAGEAQEIRAGEIVGLLDRGGSYEYSARVMTGQCPSDTDI